MRYDFWVGLKDYPERETWHGFVLLGLSCLNIVWKELVGLLRSELAHLYFWRIKRSGPGSEMEWVKVIMIMSDIQTLYFTELLERETS